MTLRTLVSRMRCAARNERGMTLVELMVSIALMTIVATIFTTVLFNIQQAVVRQQARSEMNDAARLAIEQMDREIRSGSHLFTSDAAATCGGKSCAPGYAVRVYTQANLPTRGEAHCVQWVVDGQKLFRRAWTAGATSSLAGWRMIAEGVVNREASVTVPAFTQASGSSVLNISLMLNSRFGEPDAPRTIPMKTSIAIRNTGTGDPCSPIPAT